MLISGLFCVKNVCLFLSTKNNNEFNEVLKELALKY